MNNTDDALDTSSALIYRLEEEEDIMLISDRSFQASLSAMMVPQTPTMYLAPQYTYPPVSVKLLINILLLKNPLSFLVNNFIGFDFQTLLFEVLHYTKTYTF